MSLSLYAVRSERWIGLGRLSFAVVALAAIYFDPLQPALYAEIGYALLVLYLLWSAITAWSSQHFVRLSREWQVASHAVDVVVISVLMVLTDAETSPFFVFFTFVLVAAMLRWHWRAVLLTALVVIVDFITLSLAFDPEPDLLPLVIRVSYLTIIAAMLGVITGTQQRQRDELARLSGGQLAIASPETKVEELLNHVAVAFGAPGAILTWSDPEEPWIYVASIRNGTPQFTRERADFPILASSPELERAAFLSWRAPDPAATLIIPEGEPVRSGLALDPEFLKRMAIRTVVSAPLPTESVDGRLFILDIPAPTLDHVAMARIVAEQVARRFDVVDLLQKLQTASANAERFRLARDLHDGVLQFLAGTALQLQSLGQALDRGATGAREKLDGLHTALIAELRLLRAFVDDLKPLNAPESEPNRLDEVLSGLTAVLQQKWGLSIGFTIGPPDARISSLLQRHVQHIISETVANARRHGGASHVHLELELCSDRLDLRIRDNGKGFPFQGRYDLATLLTEDRGPVMLRERVRALGGQLSLISGPEGSGLEIALPIQPSG